MVPLYLGPPDFDAIEALKKINNNRSSKDTTPSNIDK
jgi:hypothetical protein